MTLLELLLGTSITALIVVGIVGLIYHEIITTTTTKNTLTVTHEITNAASWLSKDGMMANSTNLIGGTQPVNQLTLNWIERYDFINIPHSSSYYLSGTELHRDYDGIVTTVARDISMVEFSQSGSVLTVSISCTPSWGASDDTVKKTYRIYLRTEDGG